MTQELIQKTKNECRNITCKNKLIGFDLTKNRKFCRRCISLVTELRWKCEEEGCQNEISNLTNRNTKVYCDYHYLIRSRSAVMKIYNKSKINK